MFNSGLAAVLLVLPLPGPAAQKLSLSSVNGPCSIQKVIRELARRSGLRIYVDSKLAETRVAWLFNDSPTAEAALSRIAELTGGQVVKSRTDDGGFEFTLQKKAETTKLEARWKRERLAQTIQQLIKAYDQHEAGKLNVEELSANAKLYLPRNAEKLKALKSLTPQQLDVLMKGKSVRLATSVFGDKEIRAIVAARRDFGNVSPEDAESPEDRQRFIDATLGNVEKNGMSLQMDYLLKGSWSHLMLKYGTGEADALTRIGDEELGLPNSHANPYEMLAKWQNSVGPCALPAPLLQTLENDVMCSGTGRWEEAIAELGRAAHLNVISDGYFCRARSIAHSKNDNGSLLALKGTRIADALDSACEKYGYLWWEKEGCCYFRARGWVWDSDYETPDRFIEAWSKACWAGQAVSTQHLDVLAGLTRLQLNGLSRLNAQRNSSNSPDQAHVAAFLEMYRRCAANDKSDVLGKGIWLDPALADTSTEMRPPSWISNDGPPILARLEQLMGEEKVEDAATKQISFRLYWGTRTGDITGVFTIEVPRLFDPFAVQKGRTQKADDHEH
jgi:hypothetical protein